MEKCPHCEKETIEAKKKLKLSPRDVILCPECGTKLALDSKAYFIHAVYMLIVGLSLTKFSIIVGFGAIVISSVLALYLIIKIVPFKILN